MTDIATRLRDFTDDGVASPVPLMEEAADEIERMQTEIDQFEEQLAEATAEIEKLRELWENSPSAAR